MLRTDIVYTTPDGGGFYSPDGVGRVFYEHAIDVTDDTGIVMTQAATEWEASIHFDPYMGLKEAAKHWPRLFGYQTYSEFMADMGLNEDDDPSLILG